MDITEIFDFESNKLLTLFNCLRKSIGGVSLKRLSEELVVDQKTTNRYITKLNDLVTEFGFGEKVEIVIRSKKNIYLLYETDIELEQLKCYLLRSIPEIIILEAIISRKKVYTQELAQQTQISESSIRKRMQKINKWLEPFQLKMRRATYDLVGPERQIREFIFHLGGLVGLEISVEYDEVTCLKIAIIFKKIIRFFHMKLNQLQMEQLTYFIRIICSRSISGYKINLESIWKNYLNRSRLFFTFEEELLSLLEQEEIAYLFLMLQAKYMLFFSLDIQMKIIQEHRVEKTTCYKNTFLSASKLKETFRDYELIYTNEQISSLLGFYLYYELVSNFHFEKKDLFETYLKIYPRFFNRLKKTIQELKTKQLFFNEINTKDLEYKYYTMLSLMISPITQEKRRYIYLITDFSYEKELAFGRKIKQYFKCKWNVQVIYGRSATSFFHAELIVTTNLTKELSNQKKRTLLLFDPVYLEETLIKIEKILENTNKI